MHDKLVAPELLGRHLGMFNAHRHGAGAEDERSIPPDLVRKRFSPLQVRDESKQSN